MEVVLFCVDRFHINRLFRLEMALKVREIATARGRWSFAEWRQLTELAASSDSLDTIAKKLNRPPATVMVMAKRLGISLKSSDRLKVKK
jgi:hypothetical protein